MKRILLVLLIIAMLTIPSHIAGGHNAPDETRASPQNSIGPEIPDWTLLVWMANDNYNPLPWQSDLEEMVSAETNASIVVLYDGNGSADSRLFSVQQGKINNLTALFYSNEINTGSPLLLEDFIVWGIQKYPSRYVWVDIWGHGNGWNGVCEDKHSFSSTDVLTPSELGRAFEDIKTRTGKNIDILTFDACRMGAMSVLYDLQGTVDFVLSSEMDVPEMGLPYREILNSLSPDPEEVSRMIVDTYVRWSSVNSAYSVTYSAANMSRFPQFISRFNEYIHTATSLLPYRHSELWDARNRTEKYQAPGMYDLRHLINNMREVDHLLNSSGKELVELYNDTFFEKHYSNHWSGISDYGGDGVKADNAGGISIYFPTVTFSDYSSQNFYSETGWGGFLKAMQRKYSKTTMEMDLNWSVRLNQYGTGTITVNISANISSEEGDGATFYILKGHELVGEKEGTEKLSMTPEEPGNYSVLVYLWKNGSLYNEEELTGISVPAVLRLYGIIHTTSGKTLMGGVTVTNPATGKEAVAVSNESGYVLLLNMPDFCSMGDTLEIKTAIGGVETIHTITVTGYTARSNFIQIDGYGNTTVEDTGQSEGQNIYFASALVSLQLMAIGLIATEWRKRE